MLTLRRAIQHDDVMFTGVGPITPNYVSYISFLITITLIIFQINYNYTISITLCGTKYIQHLLINC